MGERTTKPFEELNITDDFMFGAVMSDPNNLKPLLEYILGIPITRITYPERQKVIELVYGSKGVRLDIYCEDENQTVYSVEIQVADQHNLAKRIRYYHSMIDLNTISKGENFNKLKKSYVIFICCFDPFGKKRYMYTFRKQCQEEQALYLNEGADSIVLNVTGTVGEISADLKDTLDYMAGHTPTKEYTKKLDAAVKSVKGNEKWRRDYMTFAMKLQETAELAALATTIAAVKNLRTKLDEQTLAAAFRLSHAKLAKILETIDAHPEWDDYDIAQDVFDV